MLLYNDMGNIDKSDIIVEKHGYTIMMHVREISEDGSVIADARISMDKHLVVELLKYLSENIPDGETRSERLEKFNKKIAGKA